MSLTFLPSFSKRDQAVSPWEEWMNRIRQPADTKICYRNTAREFHLLADTEDSNAQGSVNQPEINLLESDGEGEQIEVRFAQKELHWGNKLRFAALKEGLEWHIPVAIYLLRPETAFTGVLHFLAQELAGLKDYYEQRMFIFQNTGMIHLLGDFWKVHQEIHWSGGMSPGISKKRQHLILLALMECVNYSRYQGKGDRLPVPHLPKHILQAMGVHLASLREPESNLTMSAIAKIKDMDKRTNLSGIPGDITGYLRCHVCGKEMENEDARRNHLKGNTCSGATSCDGCGLAFSTGEDYLVHAYTFCKQGPLSGAKCPCCGQTGPRCFCQIHWQRTYSLVQGIYAGDNIRANWITMELEAAPLLIMAELYSGWNLFTDHEEQPASPPSPIALANSLWDPAKFNFPPFIREERRGEVMAAIRTPSDEIVTLRDIRAKTEERLNLSIRLFKNDQNGDLSPRPTQKREEGEGTRNLMMTGAKGLRVDNTTQSELEQVKKRINEATGILASPQKEKLCRGMGMNPTELEVKRDEMKDFVEEVEGLGKQVDRKEQLVFEGSQEALGNYEKLSASLKARSRPENRLGGERSRFNSRSQERSRTRFESTTPPPGRVSPSHTGTSMRGSSTTHTLYILLQRACQLLQAVPANPKSTMFKRRYEEVKGAMNKAIEHVSHSNDIDSAYIEVLEEAVAEAENLLEECDQKGDEFMIAQEEKRVALLEARKCLPRSKPQPWRGDINGFMKFKASAEMMISTYPTDEMALNAILELVDNRDLKRKLTTHKTAREALDSLELAFGKPELAGPKIRDDMKNIKSASNSKEECTIILEMKHFTAQLKQINQLELLTKDVLLSMCHKLTEKEGKVLARRIQRINDPKSIRDTFFEEIDSLYEENIIWARTTDKDGERRSHTSERTTGFKKHSQSSQRRLQSDKKVYPKKYPPCGLCDQVGHSTFKCGKLESVGLEELSKKSLCHKCLREEHGREKCRPWTSKFGKPLNFACQDCGYHNLLKKLHTKCRSGNHQARRNQESGQAPPAPRREGNSSNLLTRTVVSAGPRDFSWRSNGGSIVNPNPTGSALELVDHAWIESPEGNKVKVRVIHDQFAANDTLSDISLARWSHRTGPISVGLHTANQSKQAEMDEVVLKMLLPDGGSTYIRTLSMDMKGKRAFNLVQKTVDVPITWKSYFDSRKLDSRCEHNRSIRFTNFLDLPEISILLGADNCWANPREIDRYRDESGTVVLYKSLLQDENLLIGGSRIVGPTLVPTDGSRFRNFATDSSGVAIRRTLAVEEEAPILFPVDPVNKMPKTDQVFMKMFGDNELLTPHPRACQGCAQCKVCGDVATAEKRMLMESALDHLCTLTLGKPWPEGGWRINLLWNDKKKDVPVNRTDSVRRFLATERALKRNPVALLTFNQQVEKCLKLRYMVPLKEYENALQLDGLQESYLPFSYALKDEPAHQEIEQDEVEVYKPPGKTKARPVSDGSHRANASTPSVNEALYDIPDLWTEKIQHLLIRFRTAKHLGLADISQYYHRLRLDMESVSMTRALWREGGIGSEGDLMNMIVPSASMGLKPVPALASHCRARTADLVPDSVASRSLKESYVDDVYLPTVWKTLSEDNKEAEEVLLERIQQTTSAFSRCCLNFGDGWITDLPQEVIPKKMETVKGVTNDVAHRDIGTSSTGALGLRWNLGADLPEGGTMSYRVHRPGSINLLPKKRGQRPPEGELRSRGEIRQFLEDKGITKSALLGLVMNLFDAIQLALPWTATAKLLYREILFENPTMGWKQRIPDKYHKRIEALAADLLDLSTTQSFPRRAIVEVDGTVGYLTLILVHDATKDSADALAYIHQQWPSSSVRMPSSVTGQEDDLEGINITTRCNLLCGGHKLTQLGHDEQVAGELLSTNIAVSLKMKIEQYSLVKFDKVLYLGDSLTVSRALRKSTRAYNSWAAKRISFVQRNEDLSKMFHVPGTFLVPTADKGTRAQAKPTSLMDEAYWTGKGTLNQPLHKFPITDPATYSTAGLESLPEEWINKAVVKIQPHGLPAAEVYCHRMETLEAEVDTESLDRLEKAKCNSRSFDKLVRVMMNILKLSTRHRALPPHQLKEAAREKWLRLDSDVIKHSLANSKMPQTFIVKRDEEKNIFYATGRMGYRTPILANPKVSRLTRVVLKQFHDQHHLSSPASIQARIFREFFVTGGVIAYLKKLEVNCSRCALLRGRPCKALSGDPPEGTQGPMGTDLSIWRRWMLDIAGPILINPWAGKRDTRGTKKTTLKYWILVVVDLTSRQIDAVLLEGYSSSSVLTGLRELTGRHGQPLEIFWDRASNLHAAGTMMDHKSEEQDQDLKDRIKEQEKLTRSFEANGITVHLSIPYSPWRQGRVEAGVKQLKTRLIQLLYNECEVKLTPMEASSALSTACNMINHRPLLLTAESSPDEKQVLCPAYLTSADLDLQNTSCPQDPSTWREFYAHNSPLNKRSIMVQQRIENFKKQFDLFLQKSMSSFGRFFKEGENLDEGDIVMILDKRRNTLPVQSKNRYVLGIIETKITPRSFKIRYATRNLLKKKGDEKSGPPVTISRCERSLQDLSLIVKRKEARQALGSNQEDIVIDPLFPAGELIAINSELPSKVQDDPEE